MLKKTFILTYLISIFVSSGSLAQSKTDFNHYKTLASTGSIPEDFSLSTYQKVDRDMKADRPELAVALRRKFYTGIHTAIDEIIHSEVCIFGDPISLYVKDIAKKLLKDDPETFNSLRFYTLKSNETNAFSTDQGIIFVTTGLISQVSSEAQIAYVLAHEIAHYKRKHVLERFKQKTVLKNANYYELSTYSKERELEADSDAIELYKKAFGAKDMGRIPMPNGKLAHAEVSIDDTTRIMLADEMPQMGASSPKTVGGISVNLLLYVEDVDSRVKQAENAGMKITRPLENKFYGDRSAELMDPFGYKWTLASHIEDVPIEELATRMAAQKH